MASILGYFEAASTMYEYAQNQYKEDEFILRISDIKQIHTILMRYEAELGTYKGTLGDFRKEDVKVLNATFNSINAFYIHNAINLFISWFETIHPFRESKTIIKNSMLCDLFFGQELFWNY